MTLQSRAKEMNAFCRWTTDFDSSKCYRCFLKLKYLYSNHYQSYRTKIDYWIKENLKNRMACFFVVLRRELIFTDARRCVYKLEYIFFKWQLNPSFVMEKLPTFLQGKIDNFKEVLYRLRIKIHKLINIS